MTFLPAVSNNERIGYSAETTWGTTVAANPIKLLRYTSNTFKADTNSTKSMEMQTNREIADHIRTRVRGNGSFNFELSYGLLDDLLEGMFGGTWTANVLKVGTTYRSFTFERQFTDITQFETYKGAVISEMNLNVQIGKVIDGSLAFVSKTPITAATTAGTGTTAATTNSVMNPIDSVQLIQESATPIPGVTDFSLKFTNNTIDFEQLASVDPAAINFGQFEVSGSISMYFQDFTYISKYLNWTTTSLAFTLGGASSLKYAISLAKVKISQGNTPNGGVNQPEITKLNFNAFVDVTDTTCKITRTP